MSIFIIILFFVTALITSYFYWTTRIISGEVFYEIQWTRKDSPVEYYVITRHDSEYSLQQKLSYKSVISDIYVPVSVRKVEVVKYRRNFTTTDINIKKYLKEFEKDPLSNYHTGDLE